MINIIKLVFSIKCSTVMIAKIYVHQMFCYILRLIYILYTLDIY